MHWYETYGFDSNFNPRSPYGERLAKDAAQVIHAKFQSTLPVRGATGSKAQAQSIFRFQSTLPVRGATPAFYICDLVSGFQSTLPVRGATVHLSVDGGAGSISIHAPRTGSDLFWLNNYPFSCNFNPRSPYGERHGFGLSPSSMSYFNPRSPYGERPPGSGRRWNRVYFNPRSPYGERQQKQPKSNAIFAPVKQFP